MSYRRHNRLTSRVKSNFDTLDFCATVPYRRLFPSIYVVRLLLIILGENYELRADLNSEYRDRRKDAIKKVIANMTVGKDVSGLFPDVLKNMQTEDLEQKKLVYLYLMNYAKTQPEMVILAVNTFVKVCMRSHYEALTSACNLISLITVYRTQTTQTH